MPLTDAAARSAKPREKPYKLTDSGGLQLWVHTSGSRTWRLAYRFQAKQRNINLGVYPGMTLAEARGKREDCKKTLREGLDPAAVIRASGVDTSHERQFKNVAKTWFETFKSRWTEKYAERVWTRLEADVIPTLGDRDITTVQPPEILKVIRAVEDRGAIDMAHRVLQTINAVYKFAIGAGLATTNPGRDISAALKPRPKVKHVASLKEKELPEFFKKLDVYDGHATTKHALLLTIQTLVRTQETRFAKWSEFEDLDGTSPIWRISPDRMKMDREHLIPLSHQTVALLREIRKFSGRYEHLFPAPTKTGVLSENTMLYALYRMGYHSRATVHGFRGTASTVLNDRGWNADWIEKQLAHDEEDEVRGAYNSAEYMTGRREMVQWWCDMISKV